MSMNPQIADWYRQFARNGRWGTCASCPRDDERHAYPEFCVETLRSDHTLGAQALAEAFRRHTNSDRLSPSSRA